MVRACALRIVASLLLATRLCAVLPKGWHCGPNQQFCGIPCKGPCNGYGGSRTVQWPSIPTALQCLCSGACCCCPTAKHNIDSKRAPGSPHAPELDGNTKQPCMNVHWRVRLRGGDDDTFSGLSGTAWDSSGHLWAAYERSNAVVRVRWPHAHVAFNSGLSLVEIGKGHDFGRNAYTGVHAVPGLVKQRRRQRASQAAPHRAHHALRVYSSQRLPRTMAVGTDEIRTALLDHPQGIATVQYAPPLGAHRARQGKHESTTAGDIVYVTCAGSNAVVGIDPSVSVTHGKSRAEGNNSSSGAVWYVLRGMPLSRPGGLVAARDGSLFVVSSGNNKLVHVMPPVPPRLRHKINAVIAKDGGAGRGVIKARYNVLKSSMLYGLLSAPQAIILDPTTGAGHDIAGAGAEPVAVPASQSTSNPVATSLLISNMGRHNVLRIDLHTIFGTVSATRVTGVRTVAGAKAHKTSTSQHAVLQSPRALAAIVDGSQRGWCFVANADGREIYRFACDGDRLQNNTERTPVSEADAALQAAGVEHFAHVPVADAKDPLWQAHIRSFMVERSKNAHGRDRLSLAVSEWGSGSLISLPLAAQCMTEGKPLPNSSNRLMPNSKLRALVNNNATAFPATTNSGSKAELQSKVKTTSKAKAKANLKAQTENVTKANSQTTLKTKIKGMDKAKVDAKISADIKTKMSSTAAKKARLAALEAKVRAMEQHATPAKHIHAVKATHARLIAQMTANGIHRQKQVPPHNGYVTEGQNHGKQNGHTSVHKKKQKSRHSGKEKSKRRSDDDHHLGHKSLLQRIRELNARAQARAQARMKTRLEAVTRSIKAEKVCKQRHRGSRIVESRVTCTLAPTPAPPTPPTAAPTRTPTRTPTMMPTRLPTQIPTVSPTRAPTPTRCFMGTWGVWQLCSRVCGGGSQTRTRSVMGAPRPGSGHHSCPPSQESRRCNMHQCNSAPRHAVQLATHRIPTSAVSDCDTNVGVSCAFFACPSFSVCDRSRTRCVCPPGSCRVRRAMVSAQASSLYKYTCKQQAPVITRSDIDMHGGQEIDARMADSSALRSPSLRVPSLLRSHTALSILAAIGLVALCALLAVLVLRCSSMQLSLAHVPAAGPDSAASISNGLAMSKVGAGGVQEEPKPHIGMGTRMRMSMGAGSNMYDGGGATTHQGMLVAQAQAYDMSHSQSYGQVCGQGQGYGNANTRGLMYGQGLNQGYGSMSTDVMEAVGEPHLARSTTLDSAQVNIQQQQEQQQEQQQQQQQTMLGMTRLHGGTTMLPVGGGTAMTQEALQIQMQQMQMHHQMQMQQMHMRMQMQQMGTGASVIVPRSGLAMPGDTGAIDMGMATQAQTQNGAQVRVAAQMPKPAVDGGESDSASNCNDAADS